MSYTITIEDGGRQTVLKQSDTAMSPAFAALLTWIQSHLAKE
jgi:emfourin